MIERLVYMQVESKMVTFEKENGETIIYPKFLVPGKYKTGDILKVIILDEDTIAFLGKDTKEMERRSAEIQPKKLSLRERAKRSTNNA